MAADAPSSTNGRCQWIRTTDLTVKESESISDCGFRIADCGIGKTEGRKQQADGRKQAQQADGRKLGCRREPPGKMAAL
jgi:hypothetical protein